MQEVSDQLSCLIKHKYTELPRKSGSWPENESYECTGLHILKSRDYIKKLIPLLTPRNSPQIQFGHQGQKSRIPTKSEKNVPKVAVSTSSPT
jgi:hypothetical protein